MTMDTLQKINNAVRKAKATKEIASGKKWVTPEVIKKLNEKFPDLKFSTTVSRDTLLVNFHSNFKVSEISSNLSMIESFLRKKGLKREVVGGLYSSGGYFQVLLSKK